MWDFHKKCTKPQAKTRLPRGEWIYWKQWGKKVEESSTFSSVKVCLLELEKNISINALSTDWVKLMNDSMNESSRIGSASSSSGLQKSGTGKRSKKQSGTVEGTYNELKDQSITWWRGGKLSEHISHKATLPCSIVRKAAKQGGITRISGLSYADDSQIPEKHTTNLEC